MYQYLVMHYSEFSGNYNYPVKSPLISMDSEEIYHTSTCTNELTDFYKEAYNNSTGFLLREMLQALRSLELELTKGL